MKQTVVFCTHTLAEGGTERHLTDLVRTFDLTKVAPRLLCFDIDVYSRCLNEKYRLGIPIVTNPKPHSLFGYWVQLIRLRPQVTAFVNGRLNLFPWYAYLAAWLAGSRRVIAVEHLIAEPPPAELEGTGMPRLLRNVMGWRTRYMFLTKLAARLCTATICVSEAVRRRLVREYGFPAETTVTVNNGVDLGEYGARPESRPGSRDRLRIGAGEHVLLSVARLNRHKGLEVLLDAFALITAEYPTCRCIVLGDGPLRDALGERARRKRIERLVRFEGHVEDVRPYLAAADVFVLPSWREGMPLSLLEAMAAGLPCVVTDVGGNSEVIIDGESGLIVPPGAPVELGRTIAKLLSDERERIRLSHNARKRISGHFDLQGTMGRLRAIILDGKV